MRNSYLIGLSSYLRKVVFFLIPSIVSKLLIQLQFLAVVADKIFEIPGALDAAFDLVKTLT